MRELVRLFKAFDRDERAQRQLQQRQVVDPSGLRNALHSLDAKSFSVGALPQAWRPQQAGFQILIHCSVACARGQESC